MESRQKDQRAAGKSARSRSVCVPSACGEPGAFEFHCEKTAARGRTEDNRKNHRVATPDLPATAGRKLI